jgi:high-affinity nickel-transport protein
MDPVLSAAALGFVLGLQHATDPDHVVAVATLVTREGGLLAAARVGLLWGLGHTLALAAAGGTLVALNLGIPARLATGLELLVAAMLVSLGALRLSEALRGIVAVAPTRRLADHEHGRRTAQGAVHVHGGHAHVHPSAALLDGAGIRALVVGAVHGVAGTAAVALLVLATLRTASAAAVYLAVFGLGTLAGMTALTAVLAYPVARLSGLPRMRAAMGVAAGVAAIAFGCWYAARLV